METGLLQETGLAYGGNTVCVCLCFQSACSKTCGQGTRTVTLVGQSHGPPVTDPACTFKIITEPCQINPCPGVSHAIYSGLLIYSKHHCAGELVLYSGSSIKQKCTYMVG